MKVLYAHPKSSSYGFSSHSHPNSELFLLIGGTASVTVAGDSYVLSAGDALVLPPDTLHAAQAETPFSYYSFGFSDAPAEAFALVRDADGSIRTLSTLLCRLFLEDPDKNGEVAGSLAESIFASLRRKENASVPHAFCVTLANRIFQNIANAAFSVADTIADMEMNEDYVRRVFRDDYGMTPHDYLVELRLRCAESRLLYEPFSGVEALAAACGFDDAFYFSKCFKKRFELPPAAFARQNAGKTFPRD